MDGRTDTQTNRQTDRQTHRPTQRKKVADIDTDRQTDILPLQYRYFRWRKWGGWRYFYMSKAEKLMHSSRFNKMIMTESMYIWRHQIGGTRADRDMAGSFTFWIDLWVPTPEVVVRNQTGRYINLSQIWYSALFHCVKIIMTIHSANYKQIIYIFFKVREDFMFNLKVTF